MDKKLTILCGAPGSGKSTLAKQFERAGYVRVNGDDQGKGHTKIFQDALSSGKDIVLDRMSFNEEQRTRFSIPAKAAGYSVELHMIFAPRSLCFKRCMERVGHPTITDEKGARSALDTFYNRFEYPDPKNYDGITRQYVKLNEGVSYDCIIVDIDGTVSNTDHRLHFVRDGKKDWKSFNETMHLDTPRSEVISLVDLYRRNQGDVVFVSGRSDQYRGVTERWLAEHGVRKEDEMLFMRPRNDSRKDTIIKQVILDNEIRTRYSNVIACIDDRPCILRLWRSEGLFTIDVGKGEEF